MLNQEDLNMLFHVALWRDEDGQVIAECPDIPGCVSQGADEDQAMTNIRAAIAECLEVRRQSGQRHPRDVVRAFEK